jgi:hypothetical protein
MKKSYLFILGFLIAFLCNVSCVKNEIYTFDKNVKLDYTMSMSKVRPATKALSANQLVFADTNVFQSYAYYLPKGTPWNYSTVSGDNGAKEYFNTDVIVSKNTTENVWKDPNNDWYWPKTYALTFFAWSLNAPTLDFPAGSSTIVTCTDQNGIVAMYYDIEDNKNVDFLVADIAADKTANENVYTYYGVPTLFRHKLSQFQATVSKKENYEGIEFTLNDITFNDLNKDGNYTQHPDTLVTGTARTDQVYTDSDQKVVSTTPESVSDVEQYIYLPQQFDDDKTIMITYTIGYDTDGDGTTDLEEQVTNTYKLSDIFGSEGFKPGVKYNLNLVFKLDQIYWDPAIENWDDKTFVI